MSTGLSTLDENKDLLNKFAMEGTKENNIKQLISDEAYKQLAGSFPELVPMVVGINIIEIFDDNSALGGAVLFNGNSKIIIPVIYVNGKVDATTFIYNEDKDIILALTKKIVKLLLSASETISGTPIGPDLEGIGFDTGDINKVFVPPKTYSPKIASSGGILFSVLEKVASVREKLVESLENEEFRNRFVRIYGEEALENIKYMEIEKTASHIDNSEPEVIFSLEKLASSGWERIDDAIDEFSKNGFVISHGEDRQTKTLRKKTTVESKLKNITGQEAIEGIDIRNPGVYEVYSITDLSPVEVVVSRSGVSGTPYVLNRWVKFDFLGSNSTPTIDGNPVVGKRKDPDDSTSLVDFSVKDLAERTAIVVRNGKDVFGSFYAGGDSIEDEGLTKVVLTRLTGADFDAVVIEKNSNAKPILLGKTLYVGDKNLKIFKEQSKKGRTVVPVRFRDLDAEADAGEKLVKVAFDGTEFIYDGSTYSKEGIVAKLLDDGFRKDGIYELVKTAAKDGNAEMVSISAKLDMLANMISNLAGKVMSQEEKIEQIGLAMLQRPNTEVQAQESVTPESDLQEEAPKEEHVTANNAQAQTTMMPDPYSGMPPSDEELAAMQQQYQQQTLADQQLLQQQPQQSGNEEQNELVNGMNASIDPSILDILAQLKDSNIMDVSVISMLASGESIGDVVRDYSGDILNGASAVGRILLNALIKENEVSAEIGEKKYKQLIKNLRNIFKSMSELYADIVKLELESNGKMGTEGI